MTKKQKLHTYMINLALEVYGKNMLFAGFCIAYCYDRVTTKQILTLTRKLEIDKASA